jgi:3-oxoacyl-[acyl-carrier-protein] synthase-1
MALVPGQHVDPLCADLAAHALSDRERRMLQLGGMALEQVKAGTGNQLERALPLFLALPEPNPGRQAFGDRGFIEHLSQQSGVRFDSTASRCFEGGRASGFLALQAALSVMAAGCEHALVGGIDTCLDLTWVAKLDAERRLLREDVRDGFVPGEAAAFLLLTRARSGAIAGVPTQICAVGTADDPGHRYSDAPALGVGLAAALDAAWISAGALPPIQTCFAGLNGESFGAKEWGVAHIRHHQRFDPALAFEHPADCFGDVGAAMGPLLLVLADEVLRNRQRQGPILTWASSDHAPVGCALLSQ